MLSSQCRSSTNLTGVSLAGRAGTAYILDRALRLPPALPRSPFCGSIMSTFRNRGTGGKAADPAIPNPSSVLAAGTSDGAKGFVGRAARSYCDADDEGTAAGLPDDRRMGQVGSADAGAIRECEEHSWMRDRGDPHARERALLVARRDPPPGVSPGKAVAAVRDVLDTIGDTCPECPAESG